jgi:hypothetical protein
MASLKKQVAEEKKPTKTKAAKPPKVKDPGPNPELKCWSQDPSLKHHYEGKLYTLQEYLDIPLHKKWNLTIKDIKDGLPKEKLGDSADKRLTEPCKGKVLKQRSKFCPNCKRRVRKFQLKVNNAPWLKRHKAGVAGHYQKYRGKPTELAKQLKKLGEDPKKRLVPGKPLPKVLVEKLEKAEAPKVKVKAEPKPKPPKEKPVNTGKWKKPKKVSDSRKKQLDTAAAMTGGKVKQGPITKEKRPVKQADLPLNTKQLKDLNQVAAEMNKTVADLAAKVATNDRVAAPQTYA